MRVCASMLFHSFLQPRHHPIRRSNAIARTYATFATYKQFDTSAHLYKYVCVYTIHTHTHTLHYTTLSHTLHYTTLHSLSLHITLYSSIGHRARQRTKHVPSTNGCGAGGLAVQTLPEMVPCCDEHDYCYDTCGSNKQDCDNKFQECLLKTCEAPSAGTKQECEASASLLSVGVNAFGCHSFQLSQKKACVCLKHEEL